MRGKWRRLATVGILALSATGAAAWSSSLPCSTGQEVPLHIKYPGFNPLTATDAQLTAHQLPERPTDPVALASWTRAMKHIRYLVTAPLCIQGPKIVNVGPGK